MHQPSRQAAGAKKVCAAGLALLQGWGEVRRGLRLRSEQPAKQTDPSARAVAAWPLGRGIRAQARPQQRNNGPACAGRAAAPLPDDQRTQRVVAARCRQRQRGITLPTISRGQGKSHGVASTWLANKETGPAGPVRMLAGCAACRGWAFYLSCPKPSQSSAASGWAAVGQGLSKNAATSRSSTSSMRAGFHCGWWSLSTASARMPSMVSLFFWRSSRR